MHFEPHHLYHIYNRGNDRQTIFFKRENYLYFLQKLRKSIVPHCEVLAYCLMPNHFHLLVNIDERIASKKFNVHITKNVLSEGFRHLLSSYTKGINKQESRTGHLFTQNTKAKCVTDDNEYYGLDCLLYVHQNPVKAGLVEKTEDWEFSSYRDYAGLRAGTLCNKSLAFQLLDIDKVQIVQLANTVIPENRLKCIF